MTILGALLQLVDELLDERYVAKHPPPPRKRPAQIVPLRRVEVPGLVKSDASPDWVR